MTHIELRTIQVGTRAQGRVRTQSRLKRYEFAVKLLLSACPAAAPLWWLVAWTSFLELSVSGLQRSHPET